MTLEDLQGYRALEILIKREKERLEDLRESADVRSARLDGMPRTPGVPDRIGHLVPEIIDQEKEIAECLQLYYQKKREIEQFINNIPNMRLRLIYQLRFIDDMAWQQIADEIGGKETEYSVKSAAYRYLKDYNAWSIHHERETIAKSKNYLDKA